MTARTTSTARLAAGCGAALLLAAATSGCSAGKEALGLTKTSPDEFTVLTKKPLAMPPTRDLPTPQPGALGRASIDPNASARSALGASDGTDVGRSGGEASLIAAAGAGSASPQIRSQVDSETAEVDARGTYLIDRILGTTRGTSATVDATPESQRIRAAQQGGQPVTGDGAVEIKPRKKGLLEGLF